MENAKALDIINWLYSQDKEKTFDIKVHKRKRSLNANAYCWMLLGKIADEIGTTKEEIYRDYIKHKGIYKIITMSTEAVSTFIKVWNDRGLGWVCETSETSIVGLTDVIAYYGTSSYNTKQMAKFIDYVVQECQNLEIETKSKEDIDSLLKAWEAK